MTAHETLPLRNLQRRNRRASCSRTTPNQLTAEEVFAIREMVTSSEFRWAASNVRPGLPRLLDWSCVNAIGENG